MPKVKKVTRKLPKFSNEDQERQFWATHGSSAFVNWQHGQRMKLPNLRPTTQVISLRLPVTMIESLKVQANKRGVSYQSLLKMYVAEKLEEERREARH